MTNSKRQEVEAMIKNLKKCRTIRDVQECPLVDVWLEDSDYCPETNPKAQLWWCCVDPDIILGKPSIRNAYRGNKRIIDEINAKAWYFVEE